jgi:PAS domain-containing protein
VWVNAQCKAVRGFTPGELLRMKSGESAEQVHPDDRIASEEVMRRLMAAPEGEVMQWLYRIRHPESGWRRLRTRCLVFRHGPDGRPWHVLGVSEDVTDET